MYVLVYLEHEVNTTYYMYGIDSQPNIWEFCLKTVAK